MWFTKLSLPLYILILTTLKASVCIMDPCLWKGLIIWQESFGCVTTHRDCLYSVFVSVGVFAMTLMYRWNFISYSTVSLPHILISKYRNCYLKMKPVSCFLSRIMGDWWSIIAWWTIPLCYSANNSVEIFRTKQNKLDWATWISSLTSLAWRHG